LLVSIITYLLNKVLSQSLSAGEVVAKDTKITITVNKIEKKNNDKTNDNNTTNNENTTKPDNTVTHDPTNEVDEH
jgi:beta-lactam-binding protein with PASTA domain